MAWAYVPADGGPHSLPWPLGTLADENDNWSVPGPIGVSPPVDFLTKSLRVLAIDFESDHWKKMTDKGYPRDDTKVSDYEAGGNPFPEYWTYRFNPDILETTSYPVSHTGGRKVDLLVAVSNEYATPVVASLTGSVENSGVARAMQFIHAERTFEPGITLVRVISNEPLRKHIQAEEFKVRWEFAGPRISSNHSSHTSSIYAPPMTTTNELFVTLGEPQFEGKEFTYERLGHAVRKLGAFDINDPHQIVESLVHSVGFEGRVSKGAWFLAISPKLKADCITIAKYVAALLQMVGIHGKVTPVIVYARPKAHVKTKELIPNEQVRLLSDLKGEDVEVVEKDSPEDPALAGLLAPMIVHPQQFWRLTLLDDSEHFNNYEGCVKFRSAAGITRWYPAGGAFQGVDKVDHVIPTVFTSLSWIDNDDKPKGIVKKYR